MRLQPPFLFFPSLDGIKLNQSLAGGTDLGAYLHPPSPTHADRAPTQARAAMKSAYARPPSSGRGLFDLLVRAWTSTDYLKIRWVWCARSASKGGQQPSSPLSSYNGRGASTDGLISDRTRIGPNMLSPLPLLSKLVPCTTSWPWRSLWAVPQPQFDRRGLRLRGQDQ